MKVKTRVGIMCRRERGRECISRSSNQSLFDPPSISIAITSSIIRQFETQKARKGGRKREKDKDEDKDGGRGRGRGREESEKTAGAGC
jgi:hypothetical protein